MPSFSASLNQLFDPADTALAEPAGQRAPINSDPISTLLGIGQGARARDEQSLENQRAEGVKRSELEKSNAAAGVLLQEAGRLQLENVPQNEILPRIMRSPLWTQNIMNVDASAMGKLIQELTTGPKATLVGEGGALVSPTGTELYKNPGRPQVVGEGGALVSPSVLDRNQGLFVNQKQPVADKTTEHEIAKRNIGNLDKVIDAGEQARMDGFMLQRMRQLTDEKGGVSTGVGAVIRSHLARVGIDLGDASDIQALEAAIDRLTPVQRQGMPGAASDRDVAMFKGSLPSLMRTPKGNAVIIDTLDAMAQDKIARAGIAQEIFDGRGGMTLPKGLDKMRALPSPMDRFNAMREQLEGQAKKWQSGDIAPDAQGRQRRFKGGNPRVQSNWELVQ